MTDLHVGIVGREPGWRALLKREGVPFKEVAPPFKSGEHPVLVVGASATRDEIGAVRTFINDGGAVLLPPAHASTLAGTTTSRMRISSLNPSADAVFRNCDLIDLHRSIDVPQRANILRSIGGRHTSFIGREGHGHLLLLPFDVPELLRDAHSCDRSFASASRRLPFEHVSVLAKGALRELVLRCLALLFHRRGLPFAHLWYYPNRAPSIASFRIDTDHGSEEENDSLYRLLKKEEVSATWFVHAAAQREQLPRFAAMAHQEIAVHCNRHRIFKEYGEARDDLSIAVQALRGAGIEPQGHAAPYGRWTEAVEEASRELGLRYRSEFSLGYDDVPFRPRDGAGMLQIPIHPIGLGSMRRHRYSSGQASAYFDRVILRLLKRRLPLVFYHHPKDEGHDVLHMMFKSLRRHQLPHMTFREFADWWTMRERVVPSIRFDHGFVNVELSEPVPGIATRVVNKEGRESFIVGNGRLTVSSGEWIDPPSFTIDEEEFRARRFNVRIPLVRGLDAALGLLKRKDNDL